MSFDEYTSGSGVWFPSGPGTLVREGKAPGGGGGGGAAGGAGGGSGGGAEGGYFSKTDILTGSESFAWSVGSAGVHGTVDNDDATAGGDVTIGSCTAHGGGAGGGGAFGGTGGSGGTATGGDTNTTGANGSNGSGTAGGNGGGSTGGAGGAGSSFPGANATGTGCGGGGGGKQAIGGNGSTGYAKFTFTPSTLPSSTLKKILTGSSLTGAGIKTGGGL